MAGPNQDDEKPLDPAVERVRRKLVRFIGINLGLLLVAVMAVLLTIVYRTGVFSSAPDEAAWQPPANGQTIQAGIALPAGARVVSQSLDGGRISLQVELAEGGQAIFIYDLAQNRIVARLDIASGE